MFSDEEVEEALELLRVAKSDFEVANLLLESGHYPQGLFFLQQSIEKAAKAVLRALGLADMETLRKEIGHDILVKGLKRIGQEAIKQFKDSFSSILIDKMRIFCSIFSLCPEAFEHIDEMFRLMIEGAKSIQEWIDKGYARKMRKMISELGDIVFSSNEEAMKRLNEMLDDVSIYVVKPTEAMREFEVESLVRSYWKFECAMYNCAEKYIKDRNKLAGIEFVFKAYCGGFLELITRIFYLFIVYFSLLTYHALFENRVSLLRYPDRNWTPLSISENSVIMMAAKKIISLIHEQELLNILEDFIQGKTTHNKSVEIYKALEEYVITLKDDL